MESKYVENVLLFEDFARLCQTLPMPTLQTFTVRVQVFPVLLFPQYFDCPCDKIFIAERTSFAIFAVFDCQKYSLTTLGIRTQVKPVILTVIRFAVRCLYACKTSRKKVSNW